MTYFVTHSLLKGLSAPYTMAITLLLTRSGSYFLLFLISLIQRWPTHGPWAAYL